MKNNPISRREIDQTLNLINFYDQGDALSFYRLYYSINHTRASAQPSFYLLTLNLSERALYEQGRELARISAGETGKSLEYFILCNECGVAQGDCECPDVYQQGKADWEMMKTQTH
jgi:hypothetical protein